ncbi:MAG: hypothetical protein KGL39_41505 [Patescibacteria group bacterium]|nr:hypothetical protein [Patescibacteria group bacterium]
MTFLEINAKGRANLIEWLSTVLKDGDLYANKFADELIMHCDTGRGDVMVEVRGFHTASGNPTTYTFGDDELTEVEYE